MTLLEEIKEANRSFLAGSPLQLAEGDRFVVLTCIDPRLTGFLEPALGLSRHRALVVRTAGNQVSDSCNDALRSIAAAVYVKGGKEILVVGHSDCAMSRFSATDVIESFRKAGVPRSAFGDGDLRAWFAAFHDVKANVIRSVEYLRKCGMFPANFKIHGLMLDSQNGKLEVVRDGDSIKTESVVSDQLVATPSPARTPGPVSSSVQAGALAPEPPPLPAPATKGAATTAGGRPGALKIMANPASMMDAATILRDFVVRERQNQRFQNTIAELSALIRKEKNPSVIMGELDRLVKEYQHEYPNLPAALSLLRKTMETRGPGGSWLFEALARILD